MEAPASGYYSHEVISSIKAFSSLGGVGWVPGQPGLILDMEVGGPVYGDGGVGAS